MEYKASLRVFSEQLTVDKLNELIGLNCDQHHDIGQPRGKGLTVEFKENAWILNSKVSTERTLDAHIEGILQRISAHKEQIKELSQKCDVICQCIVEGNENPELNFPKELIEGLSEIGASIDIDSYIV